MVGGALGPEGLGDLVERAVLVAGDPLAADPEEAARLVGLGGVLGDGHRERAVLLELLGRHLRLDQRDRVADLLEAPVAHVLFARELVRVQIGGRLDELADQIAGAVGLLSLLVDVGHRQALADRAAALGCDHDQPGERRPLGDLAPLLGVELGLGRHRSSIVAVAAAPEAARSYRSAISS